MNYASVRKYRAIHAGLWAEFSEHVEPLLELAEVQRLDNFRQHYKYTRLRHSMDVAYMSFRIARFFGCDSRSVARAGLLHDLFFHEEGQNSRSLLFSHPRIALENARKLCELNPVEEDAILRHMFLLTPRPPRYREGFILTFADKVCAIREFAASVVSRKELYAAKRDTHSA